MAGTTRPHRAVTLTAGGVPRIFEPLFTVFGDGDSSGGSTSMSNVAVGLVPTWPSLPKKLPGTGSRAPRRA